MGIHHADVRDSRVHDHVHNEDDDPAYDDTDGQDGADDGGTPYEDMGGTFLALAGH